MVQVTWNWGTNAVVPFDPGTDVVDLGWLQFNQLKIEDNADGTVIEIVGNNQSYLLEGAGLGDLDSDNFTGHDAATLDELADVLNADDGWLS